MAILRSAPSEVDIAEIDRDNVWHHLTQHQVFDSSNPMVVAKGEGLRITDTNGNQYLDAVAGGLWTVNVGYGRESIAKAVHDQLIEMCYFSGAAGSVPGALFAAKLLEKMPGMGRVYYSSSGSEANEKAYKIVRQIAHKKHGGRKHKIIYRERDYHGTTITALSSSGQFERKNQYGPFTPGFIEIPHCSEYRCQYDDASNYGVRAARELENVILREGADSVGAIILEPITAGGGVITPPDGYFETIQEICSTYDLLLIIDEVVCGLGRTGKWFGYQHYGIKPDIVTMAKGVASGYAAISCTVTTERVFDLFRENASDRMSYFRDISTFGGCTAGPTAALENIRIIEDEMLLHNAETQGKSFKEKLHALQDKYEIIGDVRGEGLLIGLELVESRLTKRPVDESVLAGIVTTCREQGVLIGKTTRSFQTLNNTLVLSPALTISDQEVEEIVAALDFALAQASNS